MSEVNSQQAATQAESKYFDLHATGIGYLNRVRSVTPRKGETFLACSISALRGEWKKDGSVKPDATRFDLRVYGRDANAAIEALQSHCDDKRKIMVQFKLGDFYGEMFTYQKDTEHHKKGDMGFMIKGRLLQINKAWVDGNPVILPSSKEPQQEVPLAAAGGQ